MGYLSAITYTQHDESGASLRAAGWVCLARRRARKSWAESTSNITLREMRHAVGNGGVERLLWAIGTRANESRTTTPEGGEDK